MNDISLDAYCDSINSDTYYIEDFRNWVKKGIHGKDLLPRSRWDEIWDDFAGTFDDEADEEETITEFEVDVNLERPLKVRKINGKWKCSDGSVYMGYLKPKDIITWLRRDYGQAWLIESVNRNLKEIAPISFSGSKTFDIYEGFEADVEFWFERYGEDVDAGLQPGGMVEYIAGNIEREHPTENPMQFDSLMRWVRETLPKVDKNWNSNMWGPVKERIGQPFVFIKILDSWDDPEAVRVVARYGGEIDYDVWTISKENIQDIKDELPDWENRIAFYSSYNGGRFGRKLKEAVVNETEMKNLKESSVNLDWVRKYGNDPEIKNVERNRYYHEYTSDSYWDAEDWTIAKEHSIKSHFLWLVERYLIFKLNGKIEEMLKAAEILYKSFTDAEFFKKEFYITDHEEYEEIYRVVNRPNFKPAKFLEDLKEDYAHPREGCYELTYDKFVSEMFPEIKELLGY